MKKDNAFRNTENELGTKKDTVDKFSTQKRKITKGGRKATWYSELELLKASPVEI